MSDERSSSKLTIANFNKIYKSHNAFIQILHQYYSQVSFSCSYIVGQSILSTYYILPHFRVIFYMIQSTK